MLSQRNRKSQHGYASEKGVHLLAVALGEVDDEAARRRMRHQRPRAGVPELRVDQGQGRGGPGAGAGAVSAGSGGFGRGFGRRRVGQGRGGPGAGEGRARGRGGAG